MKFVAIFFGLILIIFISSANGMAMSFGNNPEHGLPGHIHSAKCGRGGRGGGGGGQGYTVVYNVSYTLPPTITTRIPQIDPRNNTFGK